MGMKVQCPTCEKVYNLPKPPPKRVVATCKKCGDRIVIDPSVALPPKQEDISTAAVASSEDMKPSENSQKLMQYREEKSQSMKAEAEIKEKSTPLAIGLNLLLPGLGYMYMGKIIVGIAALILVIAIYATTSIFVLFFVWLIMNAIMALDMIILGKKRSTELEQKTMMKCHMCAELIRKEAKICKHCGAQIMIDPSVAESQREAVGSTAEVAAGNKGKMDARVQQVTQSKEQKSQSSEEHYEPRGAGKLAKNKIVYIFGGVFLVVVVLAVLFVPRLYSKHKTDSYNAAAKNDVMNAGRLMEAHYAEFMRYPRSLQETSFSRSEGVIISLNTSLDQQSYRVEAYHQEGDKRYIKSSSSSDVFEKQSSPERVASSTDPTKPNLDVHVMLSKNPENVQRAKEFIDYLNELMMDRENLKRILTEIPDCFSNNFNGCEVPELLFTIEYMMLYLDDYCRLDEVKNPDNKAAVESALNLKSNYQDFKNEIIQRYNNQDEIKSSLIRFVEYYKNSTTRAIWAPIEYRHLIIQS